LPCKKNFISINKNWILMKIKWFLYLLCSAHMLHVSPVSVPDGGTGLSSATAYAILIGGTTSVSSLQTVTYSGSGTGNQALFSNGAGAAPTLLPLYEFAYIYSRTSQTVTAGSAYLFELNGVMSSGISHSTSSNTDQITLNRAGTYMIEFQANSSATGIALGLTVNGGATIAATKSIWTASSGGPVAGQYIYTATAGDVLRVVNSYTSSITTSANRVSAAITIVQIA
jgi:hypothetical protein